MEILSEARLKFLSSLSDEQFTLFENWFALFQEYILKD